MPGPHPQTRNGRSDLGHRGKPRDFPALPSGSVVFQDFPSPLPSLWALPLQSSLSSSPSFTGIPVPSDHQTPRLPPPEQLCPTQHSVMTEVVQPWAVPCSNLRPLVAIVEHFSVASAARELHF